MLPFLDVMVVHDKINFNFNFKVYRKPTNTENYIHYFSYHATSTKVNVVTNLFFRALRLCDPPYLDSELQHISNSFIRLGYPEHFIQRCLSKAKKKWYHPTPPRNSISNNFISLPFSQDLQILQTAVKDVNNNKNPDRSAQVAFKYNHTLRNTLVRNRPINKNNIAGVYCIPCRDCNKSYIGESGRGLHVRLEEHKRACRLGSSYSAVATHSLELDHRIGFSQAKVIFKSDSRSTRRTIEGALIALNNTFTNNKSSTSEDAYINSFLCKKARIHNFDDISAKLRTAASPLSSQVSVSHSRRNPLETGAYAIYPEGPIPPDSPGLPRRTNNLPTRSSARLRNHLSTRETGHSTT